MKPVTGGREVDVAGADVAVDTTVVGAIASVAVEVGCTGTVVAVATGGVAEGAINVGTSVAGTVGNRDVGVGSVVGGAAQALKVRTINKRVIRIFMVSSPVS